jgi:hypothetical protein
MAILIDLAHFKCDIEKKYVKVWYAPYLDRKTQSRCVVACNPRAFNNIYG